MNIISEKESKKENYIGRPLFCKEEIFQNPRQAYKLDYSWAYPQKYTWHNNENIKLIQKMKNYYLTEKKILDILVRRIKYTYTIRDDLHYISERFNWNKLDGIYEVYLCKFEHLICQIAELIDYIIRFYIRNKHDYIGPEVSKFEHIGNFIISKDNGLPEYYQSTINLSVYLSILLFLRNSLVHDHKNIDYSIRGQNPLVICKNIPENKRYGILKRLYLDSLVKLIGFKEESGHIKTVDPRIDLFNDIYLTKNSTVNHQTSRIYFEIGTLELTDQFLNKSFYGLIHEILLVLNKESKKI